jgi:hypothetical protein
MHPTRAAQTLVERSVCRIHNYHSASPRPQLGLMKMRMGEEMA